jgi:general secretion pathway protein M
MAQRLENLLARFPVAAVVLYIAAIVAFVFTTVVTVLDLAERRDALSASADILAELEGRSPPRARAGDAADVAIPPGSPFVEGATVSVAGAALLQRVVAATTQVGGNILSSQVELQGSQSESQGSQSQFPQSQTQGSQSKAGFVTVTANFEVEPASLQRLLYDIEAGMPFLFVDQIDVQAPTGSTGAPSAAGKLRVLMTVSGQWRGVK